MRWATPAQPGSCIMLCPMSGKNSASVLYAFAVARTSALVTMPSSAAPRTNIGVLTRVGLTRRNNGSTSDARAASGWTRAAHDSTMSSGVSGLNRCHQDGRRRVLALEVALHDEAAQGMGNQHRVAVKAAGRGTDIVDIVGDRTGVEWLGGGAGAVASQAQRHRAVTGVGEEVHEVGPARRGMPTAVDEQQRHRMRVVAGSLVDHL